MKGEPRGDSMVGSSRELMRIQTPAVQLMLKTLLTLKTPVTLIAAYGRNSHVVVYSGHAGFCVIINRSNNYGGYEKTCMTLRTLNLGDYGTIVY